MADKVLFVDDEPAVLDGYRRLLYREFEIETAVGGEQGLDTLRERGPFSVVISDMRMPGMNGAQFLAQVLHHSPESVRMMLTGYSDIQSAIEAINEGNIFRFLTKPCDKATLAKAITTGMIQHRLITAERELLENTLMGAIKVLTDVLSAVSPESFGRSVRIARYLRHLVSKFGLPSPWRFDAAAMLSQLGCITLDEKTVQTVLAGGHLTAAEQARFDSHPQVACNLLMNIPRLKPIAWMIAQQLTRDIVPNSPADASNAEIVFGAKALKLAVAFNLLRMRGIADQQAFAELHLRLSEFGKELLDALKDIPPESGPAMRMQKISVLRLAPGMILHQELRSKTGLLLVTKGQDVTYPLIMRLENYLRSGAIDPEIIVLTPA